jgi:hypothetical protein
MARWDLPTESEGKQMKLHLKFKKGDKVVWGYGDGVSEIGVVLSTSKTGKVAKVRIPSGTVVYPSLIWLKKEVI